MARWIVAVMAAAVGWGGSAPAQDILTNKPVEHLPGPYAPPGYYGTMYGTTGYGSIRVASKYASPYGAGRGYGFGPFTQSTDQVRRFARLRGYSTFAVPINGRIQTWSPPIGYYAPGYGAGGFGPQRDRNAP